MDRNKIATNQSISANVNASRGKQLVGVAALFFVRSMVWFVADSHWPRHPDKFWVFATFEASMVLGAIGIIQWRSEIGKLRLMDCVIVLTCASLLVACLFWIYP